MKISLHHSGWSRYHSNNSYVFTSAGLTDECCDVPSDIPLTSRHCSKNASLRAETSHERCFSWLRLYDGVSYRWCRHAVQSSWGTHSAFLYPTDTCWTRHPVFTTCCRQSETTTLRAELRRTGLFENSNTNTNRLLNSFIRYCIRNFQ